MKKKFLIAALVATLFACKKEKTETPASLGGTPGKTKHCTATVNGSSFAADSYSSIIPYGYVINAFNLSSGQPTIIVQGQCAIGTYSIFPFSPNRVSYKINNVTYTGTSGSINVTQIDTTGGYVKELEATFIVNTDTISGVSYQITNGDIYYKQ